MATVWVLKDSKNNYRVYPPVVILKGRKGEQLNIANTTDAALDWSVSPAALSPAKGKVGKKSKKKAGKAKRQKKRYTAYRYSVTLTLSNGRRRKAKGCSDPVIIIEM